jgi:erythromycin esterase-like protein
MRGAESCEDDVIRQLLELQRSVPLYAQMDGRVADEDAFAAEQNARLALDAERYYRTMFNAGASSWNLRDGHMTDTLAALIAFLGRHGPAKVVVWAHNSHLGDARATEMGRRGEHNVGQLARERWGSRVRSIGFTTHTGTVTAATDWGNPAELKVVRPSLDGSVESLLHSTGAARLFVDLKGNVPPAFRQAFRSPLLERAIGVIYRPETERASHYLHAIVADQFDGIIHIDRTSALEPLEGWSRMEAEPPETYPTAL